jgi:hypothetical protein
MISKLSLVLILSLISLAGCSTKQYSYNAPYCYTDEQIVVTDGNQVSSSSVIECSDRPGEKAEIARAGIDKSCEEYWFTEIRYNKRVPVRGVRCEKLDGSWEVLDINGTVR